MSLVIIPALSGKQGEPMTSENVDESLLEIEKEIYGLAAKKWGRGPPVDKASILVTPHKFVIYKDYEVLQWLSSIDFYYSVTSVIPFSPIGVMIGLYMKVALVAIKDTETDEKILPHLRNLLMTLKPVLASASAIVVSKSEGDYLGYEYDWEAMDAFLNTVGNLWGSEILITQFSTSEKLKSSFTELKRLYEGVRALNSIWKVKFTEETSFKLSELKEDRASIANAKLVPTTLAWLLNINYKYQTYDLNIIQTNFYKYVFDACNEFIDLIMSTEEIDAVKQASAFLEAFKSLYQANRTGYNSKDSDIRVLILEGHSKEAFENQINKLDKWIVDTEFEGEELEKIIQALKISLENVKRTLGNTIENPVDGTFTDFKFTQRNYPKIFKQQELSQDSWAGIKSVHKSIHSASSIFTETRDSEISVSLKNFFDSMLNIIEQYQQDDKLRTTFIYLYQVSVSFLKQAVHRPKMTSELTELPVYQYPRTPCFSLQDHLARFSALLIEQAKIGANDLEMQTEFLTALDNINNIMNIFGRSLTITPDSCLENLIYTKEDESGLSKTIQITETPSLNIEETTGEFSPILSSENQDNVADKDPQSLPKVFKDQDLEDSEGSFIDLKRNNQSKSQFKPFTITPQLVEMEKETSPQDLPLTDDSNKDLLLESIQAPYLDGSLTVTTQARTSRRIRKIIILEFINCAKCLNDTSLKYFVESVIRPNVVM